MSIVIQSVRINHKMRNFVLLFVIGLVYGNARFIEGNTPTTLWRNDLEKSSDSTLDIGRFLKDLDFKKSSLLIFSIKDLQPVDLSVSFKQSRNLNLNHLSSDSVELFQSSQSRFDLSEFTNSFFESKENSLEIKDAEVNIVHLNGKLTAEKLVLMDEITDLYKSQSNKKIATLITTVEHTNGLKTKSVLDKTRKLQAGLFGETFIFADPLLLSGIFYSVFFLLTVTIYLCCLGCVEAPQYYATRQPMLGKEFL